MIRSLLIAAALIAAPTVAIAKQCRDAKGAFMKCPPEKKAAVRCKAADGKFAKCGTPGAKPA